MSEELEGGSRENNVRNRLREATNAAKETSLSLLNKAPDAGQFLLNKSKPLAKGLSKGLEEIGDLGLNKGGEVIGKMKSAFDPNDFKNFVNASLKGIVVITLYFYFGASFLLLSKSAKSNPGGLYGQDPDGPPYTGPYSECANLDFSESPTEWTFPYKNSTLCDKKSIIHRPFIYRVVSFFVTTMIYSYSTGRQYLNKFLISTNSTMVLFGPIIIAIILVLTPIIAVLLNVFGAITNYEKLLPNCYLTFWLPVLSLLVYILGGLYIYPIVMTIIQTIQMLFYFLYPTFGKLEINDGQGGTTETNGIFTVLSVMIKNIFYMLVVAAMIIINLYTHLDARVSMPIIILLGLFVLSRFLM